MNGFKCLYNGKSCDVLADSSYQAQQVAAKVFKVPGKKRHMISVVLCEKDGKQVTHSTTEF